MRERESGDYLAVVRIPQWKYWAASTAGARLSVAMTPLALALAGYYVSGGVLVAGVLMAAHTFGEVAGASATGATMDRWSPRLGLAICLAAEAVLFGVLSALVAGHAPVVPLVVVTTLIGAVPAGATGGLRSILSGIVDQRSMTRALAMDTAINQASWAIGPLVVGAAVLLADAPMALALAGVPAAAGAVAALGLTSRKRSSVVHGPGATTLLRLLARPLVLTVVWRMVFGVMTAAVVPLFRQAGAEHLAGLAPSLYAVGVAVGGALYSMRRIPSRPERHADIAMAFLGGVLLLTPLLDSAVALVALYGVAGLLEGPVVLGRSLHIERILPRGRLSTGFSLQYTAINIGFGGAAASFGPLSEWLSPAAAVACTGAAVALGGVLAVLTERPQRNRTRDEQPVLV
ncbi:MAG: MFS transporter [Kibdelosporangium sp.]